MKKRSICIVTWFGTRNHGSNLQALGLSETLRKLGYDVSFLGKFRVFFFLAGHPILLYARILNKIKSYELKRFFDPVPYEISNKRFERMEFFTYNNFKTKSFFSLKDFKEAIDTKMIFIAGSDIIWNPARGYPATNFLDFAYYADLPRFSYASSIGSPKLPNKYHKAYKRYLEGMKSISVREQSSVYILESIIEKKIAKVVDPSFLLTENEWSVFSNKAKLSINIKSGRYILCYFVMNDCRYWEYVKKIKECTSLQVVVLPMHYLDENQPYSIVLDATPYEFVYLIKNAEFICTDSFHACVFSIIFKKEFYLLRRKRKSEDDKYDDLLERYSLKSRIISDESKFKRIPEIDYRFVDSFLKNDVNLSIEFLKESLKMC